MRPVVQASQSVLQGDFQEMITPELLDQIAGATEVKKRAITALSVLNEAYDYPKPSSFSRGLRIDLGAVAVLLISGTASIDESGQTVHVGDFEAQLRRTYHNITGLLAAEGATWKDVVRTTCYLRDIDRDYAAFNEVRTAFYREQRLDPLPASTGIQAILCRPDLLVEIEAVAIFIPKPKAVPADGET
jgi:2-iminobutanoate/2-iminopropanoate deaminase